MKRLLPPLLAAFALPTAVSAGNLGVADLILTGVDAKKLEKPRNSFVINVGKHNREGIAEFSNGRFMIKTDERRINLLKKSVHNIMNGIHIKNRLSCSRCEFRNTEFCT